MIVSQHDADYINYNLKGFFEHYELEKRILKLSADCVVLQKMTKEVNEMVPSKSEKESDDKEKEALSHFNQKHYKINSQRPNCNPKMATGSNMLERKQGIAKKEQSNLKQKITKERALTSEKKDINRSITKSPTAKTHRVNKSFHHNTTLSNEKSVRNLNSKSLDYSSANEPLNSTVRSIHNRMKTQVNKSNVINTQLQKHKSKDFHTIKTTKTNEIKPSANKSTSKANTPNVSRGPTPNKENKTNNQLTPKLGKKSEKKLGAMTPTTATTKTKPNKDKITTTPKIGEFKDQTTNRSISPIEQIPAKETKKRTTANQQTKKQGQLQSQNKKNKPSATTTTTTKTQSKKKEITLNTSKQSINTDSDNEITEEILQAQRNKYINTYITPRVHFSSVGLEAIYLLLKSGYLLIENKINISLCHPELYAQFPGKALYKELLSSHEKEYKKLEQFLSHYDNSLINKPFIATKTAQNGLNFITKDEEEYLLKKTQPKEINQIFTAVLILLNEDISNIKEEERILFLINSVYPKYSVDTLKSLFMDQIVKNVSNISKKQIEQLASLWKMQPNLLSSSEILKLNRSVSYMTFIIKEIFTYLFSKSPDGTHYYIIREALKESYVIQQKILRLKSINIS